MAALRTLAEEKAGAMEVPPSVLGTPEEAARVFHELRVHQIELEMQNEELRRAQVELEATRARYFDLYELAPVGYCTLSEHGLILEANLTASTLLGVSRSKLVMQPITRFIFKADQDIYYLHRKRLFETAEAQECELRLVKPDGTLFFAHLTATAARADDGAPVGRVVLSDITEHKQAELALQRSEERYRRIVETAQEGIWLLDAEANTIYVNRCLAELLGYSADEMIGVHLLHFMDEKAREEALSLLERRRQGISEQHEFKFRRKDGTSIWTKLSTNAIMSENGSFLGALGMVVDLSAQKQAERCQNAAQIRLETMLRLYEHPESTQQELFTAALEAVVRGTRSELGFIGFFDQAETVMSATLWTERAMEHCEVDHRPVQFPVESAGLWAEPVRQRKVVLVNDYEAPDPRKTGLPVGHAPMRRFLGVPLLKHDRTVLLCGLANKEEEYDQEDVTQVALFLEQLWSLFERTQAKSRLRFSEEKFSKVFRTSPYAIILSRPEDGAFVEVNDAFSTMTGYTREEALASGSIALGLWVDLEERRKVIEHLGKGEVVHGWETRFRRKDGTTFLARFSSQLLHLDDETYVFSSIDDITEQRRSETALKVALAEKEVLFKEVHHRVKNNLAIVSAMLSLQARGEVDPQVAIRLRDATNRVKSMSLVHELLYSSEDLTRIDLVLYLRSLIKHLSTGLTDRKALLQLEETEGQLWLDLNEAVPCGLILNELITNSLKHGNGKDRQSVIEVSAAMQEGELVFRVHDQNRSRDQVTMTEPTEPGLGLRIIMNLVEQLGGTMETVHPATGGTSTVVRFKPRT
ncbi:MAG: hypothetical protein A2284_04145 [Deltaproteobacteria bacterium RIFOXYA12_FULL_61_11]|nr:MAG: hypothetical protein A2284_04145 [Deltaproteobacteria bacterium RIFOXYA12_FULL_61_11]